MMIAGMNVRRLPTTNTMEDHVRFLLRDLSGSGCAGHRARRCPASALQHRQDTTVNPLADSERTQVTRLPPEDDPVHASR